MKLKKSIKRTFIFATPVIIIAIALAASCQIARLKELKQAEAVIAQTLHKNHSHDKASLYQIKNIPVLHLYGSHEEIGEQYGTILKPVLELLPKHLKTRIFNEKIYQEILENARALAHYIPERFKTEMKAISKASGIGYDDILVLNLIPDFHHLLSCSTIVAYPGRTSNGNLLFGRNLDYYAFGIASKLNMVVVYHPQNGNKFVSFSFVGLVGVLSGMNEKGLALANMLSFNSKHEKTRDGTPSMLLYRMLLEECSTVGKSVKMLQEKKRIFNNNLMICDSQANACLAEITPVTVGLRYPTDNVLWATNHFILDETRNNVLLAIRRELSCVRFNNIKEILEKKETRVDLDVMKSILKGSSINPLNLQSMIFEPQKLEAYLAIGKIPACNNEFVHLNIKELLGRMPDLTGK
jgi:predicted choloylglycine hydrolase